MMDIVEAGRQVNLQIKQSAEYQKYIDTKRILYDNKELYERLSEFRRRNQAMQTRQDENLFDDMNALLREYEELLHNSIVCEFLGAEQRICKLMQQLYSAIADGLEFDF
ncbi:MAG: YlbF family regulator [Eubacteriales bacterium]|nr:YlbF family regulator [Lachnospiraceae bacterium]MDO5128021.1 YlbF family regulator [Eubacteriales bacterium]